MKKSLLLLLVVGFFTACSQKTETVWPGYAEAEYVRVASPIAGRLIAMPVAKGASVVAGAPLFVLDTDNEKAAVAEAVARLHRSEAQAADLSKGKRQDEIAVLQAQLAAAQSVLTLAQNDLKRQKELAKAGFISGANLDSLETQVRSHQSHVNEMTAQLRVARLAARDDARLAAKADIAAAQASLAQNRWRLDQKAVVAPVSAVVDDTLYRIGEWVPAGSPVLSLLAPDGIKVRFFVPQEKLSAFVPGTRITVSCDGCGEPQTAVVSYVAKSAEFTPPVIYSKDNRAKLVFLIEATGGMKLNPGQPVDVREAKP